MTSMHVYLIGYRGSGKSTVGRQLASRLQWTFVDTDDEIESDSGQTIRDLFEQEGEPGFRDREQRIIAQVAHQRPPAVIALGGGAVLRPANQTHISSTGWCVWLKGSPDQLFARISGDASTTDRRPNLSSGGGYNEVVEVLAAREPIYRQLAQKTVVTDEQTPDEIAAEVEAWVKSQAQ